MTYEVLSITSGIFDTQIINDIKHFCSNIQQQENYNPADSNMQVQNYENDPASLLYVLLIEKRFSNGNGIFNLLYNNNQIIAVSGAYISDFNPAVVIGGVRTYTLEKYRNDFLHGEWLLPRQIDWAIQKKAEVFCLTFNSYNKWLANFIMRASKGKAVVLGKSTPQSYLDFVEHEKMVNIKHTPQLLLKKYLVNNSTINFYEIEI